MDDVAVDSDAAHTQSQHTQAVLVVVGQRATGDCEERKIINYIQNKRQDDSKIFNLTFFFFFTITF